MCAYRQNTQYNVELFRNLQHQQYMISTQSNHIFLLNKIPDPLIFKNIFCDGKLEWKLM